MFSKAIKLLYGLCLACLGGIVANAAPLPLWTFDVDVRVPSSMVAQHQGMAPLRQKVETQFAQINQIFNASRAFDGELVFRVASVTELTMHPTTAIFGMQSTNSFQLIYDPSRLQPMYYPNARTVFFGWPDTEWQGPFADRATQCLVHEFGHTRGAIDLYGLKVAARNNPITPLAYDPERSIMLDYYLNKDWDEHSRGVINENAGNPRFSPSFMTNAFPPSMAIRVVNSEGAPLRQATVRLYPVKWRSESVTPTPTVTGMSDDSGTFRLNNNPFEPGNPFGDWEITYANFLVEVEANGQKGFDWLPLTLVQSAYYSDPGRPFILDIELAPSTYPQWIQRKLPNSPQAARAGTADPDGDGISNALEFIYRLHPGKRSPLWETVHTNSTPILSLPRPRATDPDVSLLFLESPTLNGPWTQPMTQQVPTPNGGFRIAPFLSGGGTSNRFYRVTAEGLF